MGNSTRSEGVDRDRIVEAVYRQLDPNFDGWAAGDHPDIESVVDATLAVLSAPVPDLAAERVADIDVQTVAAIKAEAWDEGYMRGRHPWRREDEEVDPIPEGWSPPLHGRNANPYRAALTTEQGEGES